MEKTEIIIAKGHELILSTHRTTFEITKEKHLTRRGDCIIAVNSNKALVDLSQDFKWVAKKLGAEIIIVIEAGDEKDTVKGRGDSNLPFTHPADIVIRKSNYLCNRTLAVKADKAAAELSRRLVEKLRDPNQIVKIALTARFLE